ncbi:MAG: shikimate kinase [Saprospiraceae bacterium]|nr:shikimate kinase [Saprospiraceae bacterium]
MTKHIYLIGFMGAGKSHWGRRLALATGLPFADLDTQVEADLNMPTGEVFSLLGEPFFREQERLALHKTAEMPATVVATGGGTPCFFDNMDWMNRHGTTIYLPVPVAELSIRLAAEKHRRPLLAGVPDAELGAFIAELWQRRLPFYRQARVCLSEWQTDTDWLPELLAHIR